MIIRVAAACAFRESAEIYPPFPRQQASAREETAYAIGEVVRGGCLP